MSVPRKQGILRLRMTTWNRVHDKCIADFTCLHARLYERQVDSHDCCCSRTILFVNFNEGDIFFSISDDIIFNAHVSRPTWGSCRRAGKTWCKKCIFDSYRPPFVFHEQHRRDRYWNWNSIFWAFVEVSFTRVHRFFKDVLANVLGRVSVASWYIQDVVLM